MFTELLDMAGGIISHEMHLTSIHKLSLHLSESSQRTVVMNLAGTYARLRKNRSNKEQAFVI